VIEHIEETTFILFLEKARKVNSVLAKALLFSLFGNFWKILKMLFRRIQQKYRLSNTYITSDNNKTFRAWCFSIVTFGTYLKLLIDCKSI
jgi:hypothetical protein